MESLASKARLAFAGFLVKMVAKVLKVHMELKEWEEPKVTMGQKEIVANQVSKIF